MVDSHCHLAGTEFEADLEPVVERARAAGLRHALVILAAEDEEEVARGRRVVQVWPAVRFGIGVHPHAAHAFADDAARSAQVTAHRLDTIPEARAIGEIGLDYHYDFSPRDVQQAVFRAQLRLARERALPIIIHTREAEEDTFRILAEEAGPGLRGVVHCFTGTRAMAERAVAAGLHVSFAGIVTFPKAADIREAAQAVPSDRLLVETDSPYLAPVPFRGKRNEPAHVVRVIETIGELRSVPPMDVGEQAASNFVTLFRP